ncbi:CRAL/TRIO domain-containing protein [Rhizoclosmatium globosum]|uniref:CRAL/TRIO domain-containing protein n=1 Tax=Rhizoclosmatium globosum TaxID=329046 RepID=A0A1Y2D177_9FUNG|nr:CRAL/TRIO domain-containing protein [Rhizoclosmatium globosum]|eukprot:ORY52355.1 CRAL/TRIO domain-containing protein [Rhizoclosmatium globosum]
MAVTTPTLTPPPNYKPASSEAPSLTDEQQAVVSTVAAAVDALIASTTPDADAQARLRTFASSATIRRFCVAAKFDAAAAEAKLGATFKWRIDFGADLIDPAEVEPEATCGKGFVCGFSVDADPVVALRFAVYSIEKAIAIAERNGREKICILLDNEGVGFWNCPPVSFITSFVSIAEKHYPERLAIAIVANPSFFIWGIYNIVAPFVDPVVKSKIYFVNTTKKVEEVVVAKEEPTQAAATTSAGTWGFGGMASALGGITGIASALVGGSSNNNSSNSDTETHDNTENTAGTGGWTTLTKLIPADQLPTMFGGDFDFVYDHEVYWKAITSV